MNEIDQDIKEGSPEALSAERHALRCIHLEGQIVTLVRRGARRRRVARAIRRLFILDEARARAFSAYRLYEKPAVERASRAIGQLERPMAAQVLSAVAAAIGCDLIDVRETQRIRDAGHHVRTIASRRNARAA